MQKLGPSKADTKALQSQLAIQVDSPPTTPKSVRPPLSPIVEAELRAACAYVLHNFKPSHVAYNEQNGGGKQKQQLDYATIKDSVPKDMQRPAPRPISKISARSTDKPASEAEPPEAEPTSPSKYRYKPEMPTEDLLRQVSAERADARRQARQRAEELMAVEPPRPPPPITRERSDSHLRSVSSPQQPSLAAPKTELGERPRTAPRTDSMETTGSTPQTDTTDYPWSDEKSSTGVTSAAITPARGSKRASGQALQSESESGSVPKGERGNADWMRQELEKRKRAHSERLQQRETQEEITASGNEAEVTPKETPHAPTPKLRQMPMRRPVPTSGSEDMQESQLLESESRQSSVAGGEILRSPSVRAREAPRSSSRQESHPPRTTSRQALTPEYPPSRARSVTRQVREYIRPTIASGTRKPEEVSRPSSRASSVTRRVKEYIRPGSATGSRKPSIDRPRSESRSRSIDTFRSAVTDMASTAAAEAGKVKTWRAFHRRDRSHTTGDDSRPGQYVPAGESRGRPAARDPTQAPLQNTKPAVNLNRELPPLPSLDRWMDDDMGAQPTTTSPSKQPKSHRVTRSRQYAKPLSLEPDVGKRNEILAARMGEPTPPRSQTHSHRPSAEATYFPPPSSAPPPVPGAVMGANISGPCDLDYDHFEPTRDAPAVSVDPTSVNANARKDLRRSKSSESNYPADLHEKVRQAMLGTAATDKPTMTGGTNMINYSRPPVGLRRKASRGAQVAATTGHTPVGHSRSNSGYHNLSHNLSHKLSMDDYSRMSDTRYRNLVEVSGMKQTPPEQPTKDKKWWQRMARRPQHAAWMDQTARAGARNGVLLTDEVAGAPAVRY